MKCILSPILIALTFSVMFSTPSYSKWKKVNENDLGTDYVNFDRIRKFEGYVFFEKLVDFRKPYFWGSSAKVSIQGDCELFRFKNLRGVAYKEPMGKGIGENQSSPPNKWIYPVPNSIDETILKSVCSR